MVKYVDLEEDKLYNQCDLNGLLDGLLVGGNEQLRLKHCKRLYMIAIRGCQSEKQNSKDLN